MTVIEHNPDEGCRGCPLASMDIYEERHCNANEAACCSYGNDAAPEDCPLRGGDLLVRARKAEQ